VTLYIFILFTVGRLIRQLLSRNVSDIAISYVLDVNEAMNLCEGIYVARALKDFEREELLFWKLIRLLKDPQLMLKLMKRRKNQKQD
jgi:piezo-type mechanosensitive ion channel component 1/2